jgi:predicted RNA polymerase sigma factor
MVQSADSKNLTPSKTVTVSPNIRFIQRRSALELRRGRREIARAHFRAALALARNPMEHRFLERCVCACEQGNGEKMP